jgi:hypothetical protein
MGAGPPPVSPPAPALASPAAPAPGAPLAETSPPPPPWASIPAVPPAVVVAPPMAVAPPPAVDPVGVMAWLPEPGSLEQAPRERTKGTSAAPTKRGEALAREGRPRRGSRGKNMNSSSSTNLQVIESSARQLWRNQRRNSGTWRFFWIRTRKRPGSNAGFCPQCRSSPVARRGHGPGRAGRRVPRT